MEAGVASGFHWQDISYQRRCFFALLGLKNAYWLTGHFIDLDMSLSCTASREGTWRVFPGSSGQSV